MNRSARRRGKSTIALLCLWGITAGCQLSVRTAVSSPTGRGVPEDVAIAREFASGAVADLERIALLPSGREELAAYACVSTYVRASFWERAYNEDWSGDRIRGYRRNTRWASRATSLSNAETATESCLAECATVALPSVTAQPYIDHCAAIDQRLSRSRARAETDRVAASIGAVLTRMSTYAAQGRWVYFFRSLDEADRLVLEAQNESPSGEVFRTLRKKWVDFSDRYADRRALIDGYTNDPEYRRLRLLQEALNSELSLVDHQITNAQTQRTNTGASVSYGVQGGATHNDGDPMAFANAERLLELLYRQQRNIDDQLDNIAVQLDAHLRQRGI